MLPSTAQVVVVGGGVLGTSAAFHLAEAGLKDVVVLDRGPIASGTTPMAAGQTGYLNSDRFATDFGLYNVAFFENFEEHTGHAITFHQNGSLRITLTDVYHKDLERRLEVAAEIGDDARMISGDEARALVPLLQPPENCRIMLMPRDGWVEPKSVAVAYAAAAADRGVSFHTGVAVDGLVREGDRVTGVTTSEGTLSADWVVLAAGAWSRQLATPLGLNLRSVPVRHQALVTAPLAGVRPDQPIVRITEPQFYVRPEAGGVLLGGYGYRPLSFDMDQLGANLEVASLEADQVYYEQLLQAATPFFPALVESVRVQDRRGLPTISPDGRMVISEPDGADRLVVLTACGVGGIDRSPGAGRIVSEIIAGEEPFVGNDILNANRFGSEFVDDSQLRARCEEVYAHHYHDVY